MLNKNLRPSVVPWRSRQPSAGGRRTRRAPLFAGLVLIALAVVSVLLGWNVAITIVSALMGALYLFFGAFGTPES